MTKSRIITLLTDFGDQDWFVAAVKGEILKILPAARIVDITHRIRPHDVRSAAFALWAVYRCFPEQTVHLVVVDPGVGSTRRPLIVNAARHRFVGPDNGVFSYICAHQAHKVYCIKPFRGLSRTFHARDLFAPVAARLAAGSNEASLGLPTRDYHRFAFPAVRKLAGRLVGRIVYVDHFGNIITNIRPADTAGRHGCFLLKRRRIPLVDSYGTVKKGRLLAIEGSTGFYEISINQGDAYQALGAIAGASVEFVFCPV